MFFYFLPPISISLTISTKPGKIVKKIFITLISPLLMKEGWWKVRLAYWVDPNPPPSPSVQADQHNFDGVFPSKDIFQLAFSKQAIVSIWIKITWKKEAEHKVTVCFYQWKYRAAFCQSESPIFLANISVWSLSFFFTREKGRREEDGRKGRRIVGVGAGGPGGSLTCNSGKSRQEQQCSLTAQANPN